MGESTFGKAWAFGGMKDVGTPNVNNIFSDRDKQDEERVVNLPLDKINRTEQVRKFFDEDEIESLAESFKSKGQLQPIGVYKTGEQYTIAYGERRWRAAQKAEWKTIKAIVIPAPKNPEQLIEMQITENLQRSNPNVMELADATARLLQFNLKKNNNDKKQAIEKVCKALSCKKTMIYNLLGIDNISQPEKQTLVDTSIFFMAKYVTFRKDCRDNKLPFCEQFINKVNEEIAKIPDNENTKKVRKEIIYKLFDKFSDRLVKAKAPKMPEPPKSILGKNLSVSWKKIDKINPDLSQRFEQYVEEHSDLKLEEIITLALEKLINSDE